MQVSDDDRLGETRQHRQRTGRWLIPALACALLAAAGGYWAYQHYFVGQPLAPVDTQVAPPDAGTQSTPADPAVVSEIPLAPPATPDTQPALPELATSDDFVRDQLQPLVTYPGFKPWLEHRDLVQRLVAFIDALAKGRIAHKIFLVTPPAGAFAATRADGKLWLDEASSHRFDDFARMVAGMDMARLARQFHRLRPLLETAYGELGNPPQSFDQAVLDAIDGVLAAPEMQGPIELTHKGVRYRYADPALEALTPVQKQMLRMGPHNARIIKTKLRELRSALMKP